MKLHRTHGEYLPSRKLILLNFQFATNVSKVVFCSEKFRHLNVVFWILLAHFVSQANLCMRLL